MTKLQCKAGFNYTLKSIIKMLKKTGILTDLANFVCVCAKLMQKQWQLMHIGFMQAERNVNLIL